MTVKPFKVGEKVRITRDKMQPEDIFAILTLLQDKNILEGKVYTVIEYHPIHKRYILVKEQNQYTEPGTDRHIHVDCFETAIGFIIE